MDTLQLLLRVPYYPYTIYDYDLPRNPMPILTLLCISNSTTIYAVMYPNALLIIEPPMLGTLQSRAVPRPRNRQARRVGREKGRNLRKMRCSPTWIGPKGSPEVTHTRWHRICIETSVHRGRRGRPCFALFAFSVELQEDSAFAACRDINSLDCGLGSYYYYYDDY